MKHIRQLRVLAIIFAYSLTLTSFSAIAAVPQVNAAQEHERVVFQVSDSEPGKWNLTLNNAKNVQSDIGKNKVDVEIVVYGPGIVMLKLDSEVGGRIDQALADGVKIVACQNTMKKMKLTEADMLPSIGYVPAGVVELVRKQKEGWGYIRP